MNKLIMKNISTGFTLLELSIVIIIMGLLMMGSLESGKYFLLQNHIKATNIKLSAIQNALDMYVVENGKLPCPAPLKNTTGKSQTPCNNSNTTTGIYYSNGVIRGAVPFEDLNLTPDISFDAWKGKITYSVSVDSINNLKKMNNNNFSGINIYDSTDSTNPITNKAIYTLVSHGKNKFGAYDFSTNNTISTSGINPLELKNISTSTANQNVYFSNSKEHDDIVKYKTRMQIVGDTKLEDLNCFVDNLLISNLLRENNITTNHIFSIPSENYLTYNQEIKSTDKQYKIKCFKYGRLGIYSYEE